jgi:hypothetical protein
MHSVLRRKSKDWLNRNQYNVSERNNVLITSGLVSVLAI